MHEDTSDWNREMEEEVSRRIENQNKPAKSKEKCKRSTIFIYKKKKTKNTLYRMIMVDGGGLDEQRGRRKGFERGKT